MECGRCKISMDEIKSNEPMKMIPSPNESMVLTPKSPKIMRVRSWKVYQCPQCFRLTIEEK